MPPTSSPQAECISTKKTEVSKEVSVKQFMEKELADALARSAAVLMPMKVYLEKQEEQVPADDSLHSVPTDSLGGSPALGVAHETPSSTLVENKAPPGMLAQAPSSPAPTSGML